MSPDEIAAATAPTVSRLTSAFMVDWDTFGYAGELGFQDIDFYFGGRLGVLGDVPGDVAVAAITFFAPETVVAAWDGAGKVMSRDAAAAAFAGQAYVWSDKHLADDAVDWARLADLATVVVDGASPASAPIFAGWRTLPVPMGNEKHRAIHQLNGLRELRMARHGAAVVAHGIAVQDAVQHKTPYMMSIYGWPERDLPDDIGVRWDQAEALTNRATGVDYAVLDAADAEDLVRLCAEATAAVT
jgi:hypothetical protein